LPAETGTVCPITACKFSAEALAVLKAPSWGPVIIVSGCIGEETAVALMKAGAMIS
jgi:hypothetical protein